MAIKTLVSVAVLAVLLTATSTAHGSPLSTAPHYLAPSPCDNITEFAMLNNSQDMPASIGDMLVKIPYDVLFPFASQVQYWTKWNPLFVRVNVSEITLCGAFPADYSNAPKLPFPPHIVGPHQIVQLYQGDTAGIMAWEFKILDLDHDKEVITYGRHQMRFEHTTSERDGQNFTLFKSYEKAAGSLVASYPLAWTVALQQSLIDTLIGLSCLEQVYMATGSLEPQTVISACEKLPPVDLTAQLPPKGWRHDFLAKREHSRAVSFN
eukprot:TRINITY_DN94018_c0_g1_i1.p1 TRINITY_DN94018_c0_g1~~TRINITY_DN94018_c0_g1_i1.p1  ORF type:complete len:265 (-),score=118.43 TRINITY_DN94018_c0_g1_i1:91-885(-)